MSNIKYKLVTWHGESDTLHYIVEYNSWAEDDWTVIDIYPANEKRAAERRVEYLERHGKFTPED